MTRPTPTPQQKEDALFDLYEAAFDLWNQRIERQAREQRRAIWDALPEAVKAAIVREISLTEEPTTVAKQR